MAMTPECPIDEGHSLEWLSDGSAGCIECGVTVAVLQAMKRAHDAERLRKIRAVIEPLGYRFVFVLDGADQQLTVYRPDGTVAVTAHRRAGL
jgi:hypothetical protein